MIVTLLVHEVLDSVSKSDEVLLGFFIRNLYGVKEIGTMSLAMGQLMEKTGFLEDDFPSTPKKVYF